MRRTAGRCPPPLSPYNAADLAEWSRLALAFGQWMQAHGFWTASWTPGSRDAGMEQQRAGYRYIEAAHAAERAAKEAENG